MRIRFVSPTVRAAVLMTAGLGLASPALADDAAAAAAFKARCAKCHSVDEAVDAARKAAHGKDAAKLAEALRKHHAGNDERAKLLGEYIARKAAAK
jgi:mono/diheme cytochrome c family protein